MNLQQGDLIVIARSFVQGEETKSKYPAVVVSSTRINAMINLVLLAPIVLTDDKFPLHVPIAPGNPLTGVVQCEALRAFDLKKEKEIERVGEIDNDTLSAVLEAVGVVLGI